MLIASRIRETEISTFFNFPLEISKPKSKTKNNPGIMYKLYLVTDLFIMSLEMIAVINAATIKAKSSALNVFLFLTAFIKAYTEIANTGNIA